jgi:16S rRNA C967 or C1407 C5-methylase (RsmB/RsmF family)/NOL1/NOP2/fmu family ribosome biogenesis protein
LEGLFGFSLGNIVPWTEDGWYLQKRPSFTFDPLFHAGCYYVQEASSMFLEQALKQLQDLSQPLKVLDLAAAPGGKSTHIQAQISSDSLLVSNEVIRSRSNILQDNIIKWGSSNVFVSNNDPSGFHKLPGYFDVMVVDAPCSGSGLFRRDEEAIEEWSLNNVALCSQRQQRILADALPALREDGLLIYSTCSYSESEDEAIADWLVEEMGMESLSLQVSNEWNIIETHSKLTNAAGYRFYPYKVKGEGFFLACFRKKATTDKLKPSKGIKKESLNSKELKVVEPWVNTEGKEFIHHRQSVIALPQALVDDYYILNSRLNIQYAGVRVGELIREKLIPDHALALSTIISETVPFLDLEYADAIKYLQRQEISASPAQQGWQTVRYENFNLGWINALKSRINNYYPKELRILKQDNDSALEK